jgi:hypothetical protein
LAVFCFDWQLKQLNSPPLRRMREVLKLVVLPPQQSGFSGSESAETSA